MRRPHRTVIVAAILAAAALLAAAVLCVTSFAARATGRSNPWESATVTLSDGTSVTLARQHAHPFLAEYRLRFTVTSPGHEPIEIAAFDSGGGFPVQVRLHADDDRRILILGATALDLNARRRTLHVDGKFDHFPVDDPRLPPFVEGFTISKLMDAEPILGP